jgi:aspartate/methionine/tyrosine aminotransferase
MAEFPLESGNHGLVKVLLEGGFMRFSQRTPHDLSLNSISKALEHVPTASLLDLTQSNPTQCGFNYPPDLLKALASPSGLKYEPIPFGHPEARRTVAAYLRSKGQEVSPDNILLTSNTSEAYSYLFKLLADPGDSFLVPTPGYPLLDHLLRLEGVDLVPYSLKAEPHWPVDLRSLETAGQAGVKGLVVVNPHNPTGTFLSSWDQKALGKLCQQKDWAYISDEVFAEFAYPGETIPPWVPPQALTFRLGGLSKSLGLPQLKLSWVVLDGPGELLVEARERLELIADTYLSVGTPVQLALPELLAFAPNFQKQLLERVLSNRDHLLKSLKDSPSVKIWPAQGGWYALLEVLGPGEKDDEWVIQLLDQEQVSIQPGGFYDFGTGCFLVLSLLPQPEVFQEGIGRMIRFFGKKGF